MNFRKLRGGTAIASAVLCLGIFASQLAFHNAGQINMFLGIGTTSELGKSDYDSTEEMRAAEKENEIQTQIEGSVLMFNNNDALPIKSTDSVTLLGRTSADNIYRGGSGGSSTTSDSVSLYQALTDEGVTINATVYNALASSTEARARGDIGEVAVSLYDSVKSSFSTYNDAAIITLGRYSGEQQDFGAGGDTEKPISTNEDGDPIDNDGVPMLSLHDEERDVIKLAAANFDKVIVLLNTGSAMDIGELEDLGVDACLWIGFPGYTGFDGVADILVGNGDPSGHLADSYATDSLSSPAMRNFGNYTWSNNSTTGQDHYLIYAEDIYVGYKYYETRYHDQVLGINNASSSKGCYASSGSWDYADEMVYTFGYGSSYADFSQELVSLEWDQDAGEVTAKVNVTNNGVSSGSNYTGESKDVVELYVSLPYESGQVEKSAIQLIGYAKTDNLAPGESEIVTVTVDDYLFASYDEDAVNGADESLKGCYIFDEGDYYFAIGDDAHDALNNVMAAQGVSGLFDAEGNSVSGNASNAKKENLAEYDNTSHARNEDTGEIVANRFEDADINYWLEDEVTYLSRDNWNTYPDAIENLTCTDAMLEALDGHTYVKPDDAPSISDFNYSVKYDEPILLAAMKDVEYDDDEKWDAFIDQLTPTQLATLTGESFGISAISDLGVPAIVSADGPDGMQKQAGFSHVCENLAASTYNDDLLEARGKFMAEDGMVCGQSGVYGFGADMHRTPYGGRNFEYYSEDSTLSYLAGAVQVAAANEKGLTTYIKHFVANDQETWRMGVATLMTEQTYRQVSLKAFEGSFTKGGSLGVMGSFNRIGLTPTSCDWDTMTGVLRNEWGFKGINMTDSSKGAAHYLYTEEALVAGTDQFNNDTTRGTSEIKNLLIKEQDGYIWACTRTVAKRYFYMLCRNFAMADVTEETTVTDTTPWWQTAIYSILGVLSAASLALLCLSIIAWLQERKKKEIKE